MAGAAKAVELGYGIEPDPGPSGRLGGWAIAGIPKEAWEVHATRSAQINAAVGQDASYRSRAVAARATRDRKSHELVEELMPRWQDELAHAGYSPLELVAAVERAGLDYRPRERESVADVASELLSPGGRLAEEKTFTRPDVIVAVAPHLHGLPVSELDTAIDRVLSHELPLPLPPVAGAREPVWAAACVLADERRIAELAVGAMSSDADVGKLLGAVQASGAKLVAVGDYRQLGSVGPGGVLEALASRHPDHVWALTGNLRQVDPGERHALDHLRAGHLPSALDWYMAHGRLHRAPSREQAMCEMVEAWASDITDGRDALLVAYHRDAVENLNRAARAVWDGLGRLSGPELEAPGGRRYRAGDRVVTLFPGPDGAWVTSQRAVVTAVDPQHMSLVAVTPEGAELHMGPQDLGADKLGHAYATTAHRSQGATVDVTYALEDGGGRELAYVTMSRARRESHIHVVAPSIAQAAERLAWTWGQERRQGWALDRQAGKSLAELYRERAQLARSIPPDRSAELAGAVCR
jgi:hypothetical protein